MSAIRTQPDIQRAAIAAGVTFVGLWLAYFLAPPLPQAFNQVYGPFTVVMTIVVFLGVLTS
jgi:hypothetical protein